MAYPYTCTTVSGAECVGCTDCFPDEDKPLCAACGAEYEHSADDGGLCMACRQSAAYDLLKVLRDWHPAQMEYMNNNLDGFTFEQWLEMEEGHLCGP